VLACTSAAPREPDASLPPPPIAVTVTVRNALSPPAGITVRLQEGGTTRVLGTVAAERERTFQLSLPDVEAEYRLTASGVGLPEAIASEPFRLSKDSAVRWSVAENDLEVVEAFP
jgi:hypothetical protein